MWHARQPLLYSLVSRYGTCDEETPALSIQIMINSTPHPPSPSCRASILIPVPPAVFVISAIHRPSLSPLVAGAVYPPRQKYRQSGLFAWIKNPSHARCSSSRRRLPTAEAHSSDLPPRPSWDSCRRRTRAARRGTEPGSRSLLP